MIGVAPIVMPIVTGVAITDDFLGAQLTAETYATPAGSNSQKYLSIVVRWDVWRIFNPTHSTHLGLIEYQRCSNKESGIICDARILDD